MAETKPPITGAVPVSAPATGGPATVEFREQNIPIWERRSSALKKAGQTPRDVHEHDWTYIDMSDEVRKNIRFLWMSNILAEKRPILPGFHYDIYQPVTEEFIRETGIKPRAKDRTEAGVPRCGDAFLVWAPAEIAAQQDAYWQEMARTKEMMRRRKKEYRRSIRQGGRGDQFTGPIGDIIVSNDMREIHEAAAREKAEMKHQIR
jgi:hypothetical protein